MDYINWSRLKTWRRCARQFTYKYVHRLARKRPVVPLLRGSILHEMLDVWSRGDDPETILKKYAEQYAKLFREEQEIYGTIIDDCRTIFAGYVRYWSKQEATRFIHSEVQIRTELLPGLEFVGTIDKIADTQGRLWLTDHKTHKRIPDESGRLNDLQLLFYVWAWNREHPDEEVEGIMWDYIRTKVPTVPEVLKNGQLSKRANIDTDHYTYLREIQRQGLDPKDYAEILQDLKSKPNSFYKRIRLPIQRQEMVEQVVSDARVTARTIRALVDTPAALVRSLDRTCDQCEFYSLCYAELRGLDANFVCKSEYTHRPEEKYSAEESDESDD